MGGMRWPRTGARSPSGSEQALPEVGRVFAMSPVPIDPWNPAALIRAVIGAVLQGALRNLNTELPAWIAGREIETAKGIVNDLAEIGIEGGENL